MASLQEAFVFSCIMRGYFKWCQIKFFRLHTLKLLKYYGNNQSLTQTPFMLTIDWLQFLLLAKLTICFFLHISQRLFGITFRLFPLWLLNTLQPPTIWGASVKRAHPIFRCCCRRKRGNWGMKEQLTYSPPVSICQQRERKGKGDGKSITIIPRALILGNKHTYTSVMLWTWEKEIIHHKHRVLSQGTPGDQRTDTHIFKTIPASCYITWSSLPVK